MAKEYYDLLANGPNNLYSGTVVSPAIEVLPYNASGKGFGLYYGNQARLAEKYGKVMRGFSIKGLISVGGPAPDRGMYYGFRSGNTQVGGGNFYPNEPAGNRVLDASFDGSVPLKGFSSSITGAWDLFVLSLVAGSVTNTVSLDTAFLTECIIILDDVPMALSCSVIKSTGEVIDTTLDYVSLEVAVGDYIDLEVRLAYPSGEKVVGQVFDAAMWQLVPYLSASPTDPFDSYLPVVTDANGAARARLYAHTVSPFEVGVSMRPVESILLESSGGGSAAARQAYLEYNTDVTNGYVSVTAGVTVVDGVAPEFWTDIVGATQGGD